MPVAEVLGRVPGGDYPHAAAAALLLNAIAAPAKDPSGLTSLLLRLVAVVAGLVGDREAGSCTGCSSGCSGNGQAFTGSRCLGDYTDLLSQGSLTSLPSGGRFMMTRTT
jgi:hypothetical protein